MSKYYSTQRPLGPGTFPEGHKVISLENYDNRIYVDEIGRPAWGWISFEDELCEREREGYELTKAPDN